MVFDVRSPKGMRITEVSADLIGDGELGWFLPTSKDAAVAAGIRYTPTRRGLFNLQLTAIDECGHVGQTQLRREVLVK